MKRRAPAKMSGKKTLVNKHKRKSREDMKREILRAVEETEVAYAGFVLRDREDLGKGKTAKRVTAKRGEITSRGVFSGSKSGFGFVTAEDGYDRDIFIPDGNTHGAIDGDYVEIAYHIYRTSYGEEKTEGRVLRIIEYGRKLIIGTLSVERKKMNGRVSPVGFVTPDDRRIALRPRVADISGAKDGDKVSVTIKRDGRTSLCPEGFITANFGDSMSRKANYRAILTECEIPDKFTHEELEAADVAAAEKLSLDGRIDYRSKVIFTIDGETAKDLDDAVSISKLKNGWRLGVHIADVSHYVKEKSVLDRLSMDRGTSVYFTDKVVPMLPPPLSNGACSLNSGEDKYTLSAIIDLDETGNILETSLHPAVINSRVRGVYSEVNKILDGTADSEIKRKYRDVKSQLTRMHELYSVLRAKAEKRGYIDMDIDEARIVLDDKGDPIDVVRNTRGVSERIIEQFMLTANEAVAALLYSRGMPCVYRVHEKPAPEKLESFLSFAAHVGLNVPALDSDTVTSLEFSRILGQARELGAEEAVSRTMLRSMMKAKYSEVRSEHFGLGLEDYCHFTSPIRRLSDLATHRIIHKVLIEGKRPELYRSYAKRASRAATETELRAVNAERRIEDLYKVIYMSDKIGESFDATVTSVTSFGLFATLENTCEGLVPISEMPGLFTFYEGDLTLRCSDIIYRLGDTVRVRLEEADMVRGKLRFSLVL